MLSGSDMGKSSINRPVSFTEVSFGSHVYVLKGRVIFPVPKPRWLKNKSVKQSPE